LARGISDLGQPERQLDGGMRPPKSRSFIRLKFREGPNGRIADNLRGEKQSGH
jgi:hypothetical protein